uniref:Uncharacterized protein n=1 Tax=Melopsittacus undulatus TaxID=13146 RepID=A0A8C6JJF0_MELUD
MLDFATTYFREAQSWLDHLSLDLNASLCLAALMRFMGDQAKLKNQNEVECIYEILQIFLFCRESVLRGWLLLNLLTGYFLPSNILMPYATKFLQLASSDPSSTHHVARATLLPSNRPSMSNCSGAAFGLPSHRTFLLLSLFQVAKELLQEICEQMGAGEQEEIQEFVLFANKMVRPIRPEEYLHDYLLEDSLVTITLRRLLWRTPLHFESNIYTDVHYGQMQWDYLNGRMLLSCSKEMEMQVGILAMLQHWAKPEQQSSALSRYVCCRLVFIPSGLDCCLKATYCFLTEHVMKLPFFGYTIYFVERVSDDTISVPCFFGVNKEKIIVVDKTSQVFSCVIPLKELQKMRTLRPLSDGGLPGLELNYGSAASPKTMWLELSQAKEMYHTIVVILDKTELHH